MSEQATIAEILAIAPGTKEAPVWINSAFEGIVTIAQGRNTQNGGKAFDATVTDPHNPALKLETTFYSANSHLHGALVRFSGKGMTRTAYGNKQKFGVGKNTVMEVLGKANGSSPPATQQQGSQPPTAQDSAPAAVKTSSREDLAFKVMGLALEELRIRKPQLEPGTVVYQAAAFVTACDLLRAIDKIAAGQLAAAPADREAKGKKDTKAKDEPTPEPKPSLPAAEDPDQDVPF